MGYHDGDRPQIWRSLKMKNLQRGLPLLQKGMTPLQRGGSLFMTFHFMRWNGDFMSNCFREVGMILTIQ